MENMVWKAELTDEEWEKVSEQDLDQMCDDLDIFWEQLKTRVLDKYVQDTEGG
ncbi:hypothetical protein ES705_16735 [subsurface metagenome]